MKKIISIFILSISLSTLAQTADGLYAEIQTTKGKILLQLEYEKAPITVANFVSLAEGNNPAVSAEFKNKKFYDGLKFHRVVANFMIQGGDPAGNGSGGPGYKFVDEFTDLKHDKAGILSMANSGPTTNGSQFFITHLPTPHLDGRHTVFGHVVEGQSVVDAIVQDDVMQKITIIRVGSNAKKFDAVKTFTDRDAIAPYKKTMDAKLAYFEMNKKAATKSPSGLEYKQIAKGTGVKPAEGTTVYVHYAGYFEDGELFDSSYEDVSKAFGKFNQQKADAKAYKPFPFQYGNKGGLIPGFLEAVNMMTIGDKYLFFIPASLGYGAAGAGGVIPPNANLIFELELLEKLPE
jgi:cyclophilin family peptidyl-prolyl cis-trans isomerase